MDKRYPLKDNPTLQKALQTGFDEFQNNLQQEKFEAFDFRIPNRKLRKKLVLQIHGARPNYRLQ